MKTLDPEVIDRVCAERVTVEVRETDEGLISVLHGKTADGRELVLGYKSGERRHERVAREAMARKILELDGGL